MSLLREAVYAQGLCSEAALLTCQCRSAPCTFFIPPHHRASNDVCVYCCQERITAVSQTSAMSNKREGVVKARSGDSKGLYHVLNLQRTEGGGGEGKEW